MCGVFRNGTVFHMTTLCNEKPICLLPFNFGCFSCSFVSAHNWSL